MGVDERLQHELGRLAPADPSGAYERVVEKRVRRGATRRVQVVALTVIVLAGSALGIYGLLRVFGVGDRTTPAGRSEGGILFIDQVGGQTDLFVVRPDGTGLRNLTHDAASEGFAAWAPDGTRIAFVRFDPVTGAPAISLMNADGTGLDQVTEPGAVSGAPAWSPDGSWIAYADGDGLWIVPADGGRSRLLADGRVTDPTWSPDGERIAYSFSELGVPGDELSGLPDLWMVPIEGGDPIRLTNTGQAYEPDWSPDGERIVFTSGRDIAVLDLDTGAVRVLTGFEDPRRDPYDRGPAWSPDGSQIVFASDRARDGSMQLYRMYADGSEPTPVLDRTFAFRFLFLDPDWVGDVPPISTEPSGTTSMDAPTELAGVGPVCSLSSVQGEFGGRGDLGTAYVFAEPDEAGGCLPDGAGLHRLGIDLGSGRVEVTSGPLECGLAGCSAFAAPDIDGDGRSEIAILTPSSGVPWDFVALYRMTSAGDGPGEDGTPSLERIEIARTIETVDPSFVDAFGGPGPALLPWGRGASQRAGGFCLPATTGHDAAPARLSWWIATSEGSDRWHVLNPTFDASGDRLTSAGIGDYIVPDQVAVLPEGGGDTFCGAPVVG